MGQYLQNIRDANAAVRETQVAYKQEILTKLNALKGTLEVAITEMESRCEKDPSTENSVSKHQLSHRLEKVNEKIHQYKEDCLIDLNVDQYSLTGLTDSTVNDVEKHLTI